MDLDDEEDINFNDNNENLIPNNRELNEQELLETDNDQSLDENDSERDHLFPYIEEDGLIHWFCNLEGNEYFVENR